LFFYFFLGCCSDSDAGKMQKVIQSAGGEKVYIASKQCTWNFIPINQPENKMLFEKIEEHDEEFGDVLQRHRKVVATSIRS